LFISLILLFGSFGWLLAQPSWEPALFFVPSIGAFAYHGKKQMPSLKTVVDDKLSKTFKITEEGKLIADEREIARLFSDSFLGKKVRVKFKHSKEKQLIKYAKKNAENESVRHSLLKQANDLGRKCELVKEGFDWFSWLYRNKYLNISVEEMPSVFSNFVAVVFSSVVVPRECSKFDIYTSLEGVGEIGYPVYLDAQGQKEIYNMVESEFPGGGSTFLKFPYNFFVAGLPIWFSNLYILPSHVYYGIISFKTLTERPDYWRYFNWSIGLG